jgi:hypothetical protein
LQCLDATFNATDNTPRRPFLSLTDARDQLLDILAGQASPGLEYKSEQAIAAYASNVHEWGASLDELLLKYDKLKDTEARAVALLQAHRKSLDLYVAKYTNRDDPGYWGPSNR